MIFTSDGKGVSIEFEDDDKAKEILFAQNQVEQIRLTISLIRIRS
jgi:hypothetical protein